jgi:hypothetical protein
MISCLTNYVQHHRLHAHAQAGIPNKATGRSLKFMYKKTAATDVVNYSSPHEISIGHVTQPTTSAIKIGTRYVFSGIGLTFYSRPRRIDEPEES